MPTKLPCTMLACAVALVLVGCTSSPTVRTAATDEGGSVEMRALTRWNLLIAGKAAEAYDYLSPGYRQVKTRDVYASEMTTRPVRWTRAEVQGSECPDNAGYCDVTVNVHYELNSTLPGVGKLSSFSPVIERWISSQGSWYLVPKEVARN